MFKVDEDPLGYLRKSPRYTGMLEPSEEQESEIKSINVLISVINSYWEKLNAIKTEYKNSSDKDKLEESTYLFMLNKIKTTYDLMFKEIDLTMDKKNLEYNAVIINEINEQCFQSIFRYDDLFYRNIVQYIMAKITGGEFNLKIYK